MFIKGQTKIHIWVILMVLIVAYEPHVMVFAQQQEDSQPTQEQVSVIEEEDNSNLPTDEPLTVLDEDDINVQQPVEDLMVQETVSPQESISTEEIVNSDDETEVVPTEEDNSTTDDLDENTPPKTEDEIESDEQPKEDSEEILTEDQNQEEDLQPLPEENLVIEVKKPKPIYSFALTQRNILTHKKVALTNQNRSISRGSINQIDNSVVEESENTITEEVQDVNATVTTTIDSENGYLTLSGGCSSTYFVVLVYKNESDYAEDQSSYIFNKAFPCQGGVFSYTISQLPSNLSDGTYYILIGEQGDKGTWVPASQLTEINLNRNL